MKFIRSLTGGFVNIRVLRDMHVRTNSRMHAPQHSHIPKIAETVPLTRIKPAGNDSTFVGLCGDALYITLCAGMRHFSNTLQAERAKFLWKALQHAPPQLEKTFSIFLHTVVSKYSERTVVQLQNKPLLPQVNVLA